MVSYGYRTFYTQSTLRYLRCTQCLRVGRIFVRDHRDHIAEVKQYIIKCPCPN